MALRGACRRWIETLRRFAHDRQGMIALKFAMLAPPVIMVGFGAVDLIAVQAASQKLQEIADSAALAAAPSLALATDDAPAKERAAAYVVAQVNQWRDAPPYGASYEVLKQDDQRAIRVVLRAVRPSFFGNLMPPGGWKLSAAATAISVRRVPLCVVITDGAHDKALNIKDSGSMRAPACLVHSNRDIRVDGGSIAAGLVEAVTSATGSISPAPGTGAERVEDPFAELDLTEARGCDKTQRQTLSTGLLVLNPGVHCSDLLLEGDSRLVLAPGDHWFRGSQLVIRGQASLTGTDVVMVFDKGSKFEFRDAASVNLDGRRSGAFAGLVLAADRQNTQTFVIESDRVERLHGVIYVPEALLRVEGDGDVADESPWTVIVAKSMLMMGAPKLLINANYQGSNVPTPAGVGPRNAAVRLID